MIKNSVNTIHRHVIDVRQSEDKQQKDCNGRDLRIKKIITIFLTTLLAACIIAATVALTAAFLPYATFAMISLVIFKTIAIITAVALSIFAFARGLDIIAPKLPRPLAVVANVIHATITEVFSFLGILAFYPINLEKRNPKNVEDNPQQPILLIHGLYHNSSSWIEYIGQLKKAQVGPVFTINLGNPFGSIDTHVKKVKDKVMEIQKITGRKDIMLVGHSMGGLVASKFGLDEADQDTHVTDIITIGSPLAGTPLAKYIGVGKSVHEMRKGSRYSQDLIEKIVNQTKIQFYHIATVTDVFVPSWSALPANNKHAKFLSIPNLGHTALLYSNTVIDSIIDYYKNRV